MTQANRLQPGNSLLVRFGFRNFLSFRISRLNAAGFIAAAVVSCLFSVSAPAAQVTILHSFADGSVPNDGSYPSGPLIQASNGNFYGTTFGTALNPDGAGAIFQMTLQGAVSTIYIFTGPNLSPSSALLFNNSNLIGTTFSGGLTNNGTQSGFGTVFSTTLSGKTNFLNTFGAPAVTSGAYPGGGLVLGPDGDFYGATDQGGEYSHGTAFKIDPGTGQVTVLYSFESEPATGPLLLGQDGNFYGITAGATIFQMTPSGTVTNVYTFPGFTYGQGPLIQDASGNFYGATGLNGTYSGGTVFKMNPQYTVTILHSFGQKPDGMDPQTPVIGPNGNLYGTTLDGGQHDAGVLFELSTDGSTYNVLHYFWDGSIQNDGYGPKGLVLGSDNNFYGTTGGGGSMDLGVIFELTP